MSQSPAAAAASWPEKSDPKPAFAWWPEPGTPRSWVPAAAVAVGLLSALLIPGAPRPGIDLLICGLAAVVPVALLAGRPSICPIPIALTLVSIGLLAVSAVRASEWLVWGCAAAALCLGAAVALDARRTHTLLATVPLFGIAVLRALPWAAPAAQSGRIRLSRPWLTGAGIGLLCTLVVAALLASADAAFADVVVALWPSVDLALLPARALMFLGVTVAVLGALFAVSSKPALPRPADALPVVTRHPAEWLTPVLLVAFTIAAFLVVEATQLFGGAEVALPAGAANHSDRARQGFGQLTVVTLIVLALLAWAGRAAATGPARDRWLMGAGGGVLLVLALLLGASALRRLWLYQDNSGWTVTRLNAGAFELWVAVVLVGVAVGWLVRRTELLPRFVVGSAALGLLLIGLLGPDALVAGANVDRYQAIKKLDVSYAAALSADAVPALSRLPEPLRSCVLAGRRATDDPWFGWNLSRSRADDVLTARPVLPLPDDC